MNGCRTSHVPMPLVLPPTLSVPAPIAAGRRRRQRRWPTSSLPTLQLQRHLSPESAENHARVVFFNVCFTWKKRIFMGIIRMTKGEMEMSNPSVDAMSKGVERDKDVANTNKQQDSKEKKNSVPYCRLFSFADTADLVLMVTGSVAAVANGVSLPLMTILFGELINILGKTTDAHIVVHEVSKVALKFIYLGVANGVASFLQVACWTTTGEQQAARIRNWYLKAILGQDIAFFDKEANTGEVVGKISGDTFLIQDAMGEKVGKFIQLVSSFIGGFIVAFLKGWQLSLVMSSVIPLVVLAAAVMAIAITKMAAHAQTAYSVAAATVEQTIGSIRTVASFTGEKQAIKKYNRSLKSAYKASVLEGLAAGFGLGATIAIIICSYGLGVWFGSEMIQRKGYTGGDVINVIFAVVTGSMSLGQASPCSSAFAAGKVAAFKMFDIFNRKPEIDAYDTTGKILDDIIGNIELRDVSFSYPTRPDEQILTAFSLIIPSGMTVALVGESGSGKSTVISLIERFYDPQAGEVLIDGINIKEFQLRWIRGKIGLVSQEPVLFATSIRNNITYGKDDATIEEIRAALELANASKFINELPEGLDTLVGEHGTQLSGGQKQRVAIARAILKNPRILLLDEATSALDAESEQMVQEALDKVRSNRTTVLVAHRLSTVRKADKITVIHHGSIVEKGSHEQLIKNPDGAYSRLVQLQEVNQDSDQHSCPDQHDLSVAVHLRKQSSSWRSTSQQASHGSGSRHSFSESFKLPAGPDIQEIAWKKPSHEEPPQHHQEVPLSRLAHLNKPELPVVLLGVIAAVVSGIVLPIFGVLLSRIIHTFYEPPAKLRKDARFWSLMFVVVGLVTIVSIPARAYFFAVAGSRLIQRIRSMSFDKVVNMEIGWFDKSENSSGAIGARLSADAAAVRSLVGDALGLMSQNAATFIAGLVIAVAACWQLALLIVALVPVIVVNGWIQMKFMKGLDADLKVFFVLNFAAIGISQSSFLAPDATNAKSATASIFAILDQKSRIDPRDDSGMTIRLAKGNIEFQHVSFRYPTRPDIQILEDFCLAIQSGKTVALVGESGSGKSTVVSLLQRFYDPDSGQILLDGLEIQKLQITWLRQQMGLVSQEPVLFDDTIRANIAYGKGGEATEAEILAAAESANAHQFISALQQGYDTSVGERGVQLSGGQKQRVAIARAIIKDPKILLLDEATSALDAESERVVQDTLDHVMLNRTTIVIAHRLSTIKGADIIAVVKNGMIIEEGNHGALIGIKNGAYASLVSLHKC
ncbi:ABC transporter B family member 11 isoform X5 [Elaeis guineensis]|uniref:ABC transporter B family member 11 isoform X5 n=1 Tax=Elaeis guineensis var. tenera TaxID=51953 RepID=UPI003C6D101B